MSIDPRMLNPLFWPHDQLPLSRKKPKEEDGSLGGFSLNLGFLTYDDRLQVEPTVHIGNIFFGCSGQHEVFPDFESLTEEWTVD